MKISDCLDTTESGFEGYIFVEIVYEFQVTAYEDPGAQVIKTDFLWNWAQGQTLHWKKCQEAGVGLDPATMSKSGLSVLNTEANFGQSCSLHNIQVLYFSYNFIFFRAFTKINLTLFTSKRI